MHLQQHLGEYNLNLHNEDRADSVPEAKDFLIPNDGRSP